MPQRQFLALDRVFERQAGRADIVRHHHDVRFRIAGAGRVAGFEFFNQRNLHTADKADLTAAALHRGHCADQKRAFLFPVQQAGDIALWFQIRDVTVNQDKFGLGEIFSHLADCIGKHEAYAKNQVAFLLRQQPQQLFTIVPAAGRFQHLDFHSVAQFFPRCFQPGVCAIVERLVAAAAHIKNKAYPQFFRLRLFGRRCRSSRGLTATANDQHEQQDKTEQPVFVDFICLVNRTQDNSLRIPLS